MPGLHQEGSRYIAEFLTDGAQAPTQKAFGANRKGALDYARQKSALVDEIIYVIRIGEDEARLGHAAYYRGYRDHKDGEF